MAVLDSTYGHLQEDLLSLGMETRTHVKDAHVMVVPVLFQTLWVVIITVSLASMDHGLMVSLYSILRIVCGMERTVSLPAPVVRIPSYLTL